MPKFNKLEITSPENTNNFSVEAVLKDSPQLLKYIEWNNSHPESADKKPMVYVDEGLELPFPYEALRETAINLGNIPDIGKKIQRNVDGKILNYTVISGDKVRQYLPDIWELSAKFQPLAERLWGGPLVPLNEQAAVNINIVPPGGQQGFHKDRNEVTLLIYLTSNLGGELEYESDSPAGTQKIRTRAGTFVGLIKANEISHRVCPVQEMVVPFGSERVALVISFGLPDINYADPSRDKFLYSTDPIENQKVF